MTISRLVRQLYLLLVLALVAASCGVSRESNVAAATVTFADGSTEVFGQADVRELADGLTNSERFLELAGIAPETVEAVALTQLIQSAVVNRTLEDAGGSVSTAEIEEIRTALEEELVNIFTQQGDPDPTTTANEVGDEISAYIDSLSLSIRASEELPDALIESGAEGAEVPCVSHILVDDKELADSLYEELQDGGDFAELATANSTDPGSGAQGGDLGCASVDQWVPEFRDAVLAAEQGVVTEPVESQFGFHLILVTGVEVDVQGAATAAIQDALTSISVDVDPTIGTWDAFSNQVLPPAAP